MPSILQSRFAVLVALLIMCGFSLCMNPEVSAATRSPNSQQGDANQAIADTDRIGHLIRVSLPIDSKVSANVRRTLKQLAEKSQNAVRRPVVVLEFDTSSGKTGRGSELEACMSLALYLGDADLNRIETVAYIPASRVFVEPNENQPGPTFSGQLNGHAVLVAIAADQIAIEANTAIGNAGIDEPQLRPLFRDVYRSIANQRLKLPEQVVMSMLDKELELFRVTRKSDGSVLYVNKQELQELEASQPVEAETVAKPNEFALLSGKELSGFGLVKLNPESRIELARMLDLAPNSLEGNPAEGGNWNAVQLNLPPVIDDRTTTWVIRSLKQRIDQKKVNLIIINIENNTGEVDACLRLAQHLVEYNPDEIMTAAFVHDQAQGGVGLVALACKHLIMAPDAMLGGQSEIEEPLDEADLASLRPLIKSVAAEKQSDWSMMMQMLDPSLVVTKYRHEFSGQIRLMSNEELENSGEIEKWKSIGPIGGVNGIDALTGEENLLVRTIAEDMDQLQTFYQLEDTAPILQKSATDRWVERIAGFLSSPFVSPWLLFAAMFFFSTEMSAPGLGLPGFLAALCFILFFWSQSLDGNADWLEIIMFVVGLVFIAMEIFVLPGFGVFGVGGIVLVVSSLILASQSFLIPKSSDDVVQMSYSLIPLIGAGFGLIAGAIALRKVIPHSPYLRRMILEPRKFVDTGLGGQADPEAIVDWSYLDGESGETVTRLNPSGKARIGGRVYNVISKGQMLDKGESILVIEAIGNRIVVKRTEE